MQSVEFGVVWGVRGDPRPLAVSPFDRAPTTSYLNLIETTFVLYPVYHFRVMASYLSKVAYFNLPTCIWHPSWGDPVRFSPRHLASENQSPWAIVWHCLHDSAFSHFDRILVCDRVTDHRHMMMA